MSYDTKRVRELADIAEAYRTSGKHGIADGVLNQHLDDWIFQLRALADELERLEGSWKDEQDRCPQCGTGNPKVAELRGEVKRLEATLVAERLAYELHRNELHDRRKEVERLDNELNKVRDKVMEDWGYLVERDTKWIPLLDDFEHDHELLHKLSNLPYELDGVKCKPCERIRAAREAVK